MRCKKKYKTQELVDFSSKQYSSEKRNWNFQSRILKFSFLSSKYFSLNGISNILCPDNRWNESHNRKTKSQEVQQKKNSLRAGRITLLVFMLEEINTMLALTNEIRL